jgi:hypothetical protein
MRCRYRNQPMLFVIVWGLLQTMTPPFAQALPVDVDGDGKVGPQEVFDLLRSWSGQALPLGGTQPWQVNVGSIYYDDGYVGIGSGATSPNFPLTVSAFGYGLVHTDGTHEVGSYLNADGGWLGTRSNHPLHFFTNNSLPLMTVTTSGNVGIGTTTPNPATHLYVFTDTSGHLAIRGDAPNGNGILGTNNRPGYGATSGINTSGGIENGFGAIGVYGQANSGLLARGVWGLANEGTGVYGTCNSAQGIDSAGVLGRNSANNGSGVIGEANTGNLAYGVLGRSEHGVGVFGQGFTGVQAMGDVGIVASGDTLAALFSGDISVTGQIYKSADFSLLDHPLDPTQKYLSHSSVASAEMMNIYNGNVITDATGLAEILLPDYFEAFNKDFRYQLTVIGQFAQAIVEKKIQSNRFMIRTDKPNVEVSWQVTGVRQDPWAKAHPLEVEKIKPERERGKYLAPELYGQPKDKGINYCPEMQHMSKINTHYK